MEATTVQSPGIFGLPNELLLRIFDLFESKEVIALTSTCRNFHSLALRVIYNRLQIAAGLAGHTMFLDCHHPAARTPGGKLHCNAQDTEGLEDLLTAVRGNENYDGQISQVFRMYTPFKPQRRPPDTTSVRYRVPGDLPGSRTYQSPDAQPPPFDPNESVSYTITVDSQEVFSQLSCLAYLGKNDFTQGMMFSIQELSVGHLRIWRDWLSKRCESKTWNDGEPIAVYHEPPPSPLSKGKGRSDSVVSVPTPWNDPSILWVDNQDKNMGLRFRVRERVWRDSAPVSYASEIEAPVTYRVELEEILVRTSHLLRKLEAAEELVANQTGKVIVFTSYRR